MRKTIKITLIFIMIFLNGFIFAIPFTQVQDLRRYEKMARDKFMEIGRERKKYAAYDPTDPNDKNARKYRELSQKMVYYKEKMWQYHEAQSYQTHTLYVIRDTVVWSAQDAWEMGKILFNTNSLKMVIKQEWTELIKSTYDAMFRMKIRKLIREEMKCSKPITGLEDTLMGMITPEVKKSEAWQKLEKGADKGLDKLKEKYRQAAIKRFKTEWLKKTKGMNKQAVEKMAVKYGKDVMETATKSIDALKFTTDIAQKIYFWNEYEPTIRDTVSQLELIKKRYADHKQDLSCDDVYMVWAGKKKIPLISKQSNTNKMTVEKLSQETNKTMLNKTKEREDLLDRIKAARRELKRARDAGHTSDAKDLQMKIKLLSQIYADKGGSLSDFESKTDSSQGYEDDLSDQISQLEKEIKHAQKLGITSVVREKKQKLKWLKRKLSDKEQDSKVDVSYSNKGGDNDVQDKDKVIEAAAKGYKVRLSVFSSGKESKNFRNVFFRICQIYKSPYNSFVVLKIESKWERTAAWSENNGIRYFINDRPFAVDNIYSGVNTNGIMIPQGKFKKGKPLDIKIAPIEDIMAF